MAQLPHTYDSTDQLCATTLRMMSVDAIQQANSGHPGLPLGTADIVTVLYTRFLKHNPAAPEWPDRDRFILSAGHGSALLYALLHVSGYPLSIDDVKNFRQWGSHTAGHPEYDPALGIEITTGPLGQGFGNAVGMAIAERHLAARFNRSDFPIVDHFTYVLASDGDLMEGVSHEAASLAGHLGLGRLIVFFDDNHISIDGDTSLSNSDDVLKRFAAYGWHVQQADGHDMPALDAAIQAAQAEEDRPSLIACRTHIGYGSPWQDTPKVHGSPLGPDGVRATKEKFNWPLEPTFHIPPEVRKRFEQVGAAGAAQQAAWEAMLTEYRQVYPDLAIEWERHTRGELPPNWDAALPDFTGGSPLATRATSGKVLEAIYPHVPSLLGGSADLSGSNNTKPKDIQPLHRSDFSGRYIHYGIREHGMGAAMNGLAVHGLRPYGGTFLVFADYLRPSIRVAALMKQPVVYVLTHDSIGLGEDGPTHQPVETLTSLRVIPNLVTIRPADGNETAQAWKVALERKDGPTALALSRQKLPQITPKDNGLKRGAYILSDAAGTPDLTLIASGSEVALAMEAQIALQSEGIAARVVSMPSWELFAAQSTSYQDEVLLSGTPRLAIEAGSTLAWPRYADAVIGIDRFGASAPGPVVYEKFGFSIENIVQKSMALVNK